MIVLLCCPEYYSCINAVLLVVTQANFIALSSEEFHVAALFVFVSMVCPCIVLTYMPWIICLDLLMVIPFR